jgi:hypothetical protein
VQETYRRVFQLIQRLINFPDLDKRFGEFDLNRDGAELYNSEYNLWNPNSKACFIVLWLYSIEPPLYYFFNEACRLRNKAVLPLLGPFAAAVGAILLGAEWTRADTIKRGYKQPDSPLGCMAGAFLLFRGSLMPPHSIAKFALMKNRPLFEQTMTDPQGKQWGKDLCLDWDNKAKWEELTPEKKVLAGFVYLPGAQSTSVSFKVALEFAFPSKDTQGHVPTLFVVCCHNYYSF